MTLNCAYRIHPKAGKLPNKKVKDNLAYVHLKAKETYNELIKHNDIESAVIAVNKVFGGGALFYLFQCILDFSYFFPEIINPYSRPFMGAGGKDIHNKLGLDIIDLTNIYNEKFNSNITPYNIENALCEYRKYINIKFRNKITKPYKFKA